MIRWGCDEEYLQCRIQQAEGCDEKVCAEHETDELLVIWNDGEYSGLLHQRGTCKACDSCWEDVDANTAYNAAQAATA